MSVRAERTAEMHSASNVFKPRATIDGCVLDVEVEFPVRGERLSQSQHACHAELAAEADGSLNSQLRDRVTQSPRQGRDEIVVGSQSIDVKLRGFEFPLLVGQAFE